jgi:hypothetical protein
MALNKKSLIQIVVLVVLIVAGGAMYLAQDSGTDLVSMFMGEEKKPEPPAPVAPPKPDIPPIPTQPVKGTVHGKPFTLERAYIERGQLVLVSVESGVAITLPGKQWEIPVGKNFKYVKASGTVPKVRASWRDDAKGGVDQQDFTAQYTMQLDLGAEKDRRVSGKLHLSLPDAQKSTIAGTFEAELKGFRIVDGKPDLASDSVETLEYLAFNEVLKDNPDKPIEGIAVREERIDLAADRTPTGFLEMEHRLGENLPVISRYQFVKEKGEWRILRPLKLTEIDQARPYQAPDAKKDSVERVFPYLAAKRLEAELAKKAAKKGVFEVGVAAAANDKKKIGQAEVTYKLEGAAEPAKVTYLFRLQKNGWQIDRALTAKERLNLDAGKIEPVKTARK